MADLDLAELRRLAEAAEFDDDPTLADTYALGHLHDALSPAVVLRLLDRLEAAEARVRELEGAVAHTHTTAPGTGTLTHTHRKGDVPHGHHGWRYGTPVPEEPESTPAAEPMPSSCDHPEGHGYVHRHGHLHDPSGDEDVAPWAKHHHCGDHRCNDDCAAGSAPAAEEAGR